MVCCLFVVLFVLFCFVLFVSSWCCALLTFAAQLVCELCRAHGFGGVGGAEHGAVLGRRRAGLHRAGAAPAPRSFCSAPLVHRRCFRFVCFWVLFFGCCFCLVLTLFLGADACNGTLAGLVAATSCCSVVQPWAAVLAGVLAALVYQSLARLMLFFRLDDPVQVPPKKKKKSLQEISLNLSSVRLLLCTLDVGF
jgi:hypothetical protein